VLCLSFERGGAVIDGRMVRRACFERRSSLPVSAACVVANGVRETLASLLGRPAEVRLLEPMLPDGSAWNVIAADASIFSIRGSLCDAALVLRPADALALAAAAFGEFEPGVRALSAVEEEVLSRAAGALAGTLSHVCGTEPSRIERILDIRGFATYFEVVVERPAQFRLGVALSREPVSRANPGLCIEDLLDLQVEIVAEFARGSISAGELLNLRPGAVMPMMTRMGEPGLLRLGTAVLARGECGAVGDRTVMMLRTAP